MNLNPGSEFAGYRIERRLGIGGMGTVYAARHPRLPRRVALKVLGEHLGADPEFRARFEREAELAARVDHPNVVSVYDRGVEADQLWIAMQYVDGVDVHQLIKRGRTALSAGRAVFILAEAAKGLDSAHRKGLLHRDIKPANILVAEDPDEGDHVLVTDFGIARALDQTSSLTNAGSIPATLPFASPEQISGRDLDSRSDIYSLGCTLYVMLTGAFPYPRDSQIAVMHAHLTDPPPRASVVNPSLPVEMDEVIARAMAKEPGDRYRSCRELASAAHGALLRSGHDGGWSEATTFAADYPTYDLSYPSNTAATQYGTTRADLPPTAVTRVPGHGTPPRGSKRGILVGLAVAAVVIALAVGATLVLRGGKSHDVPVANTSSAAPTSSTAPPAGPWQAYDFVAKALPGLMPDSPSGTAYQGAACEPVDIRFEPIDGVAAAVPIARIACSASGGAQSKYIANYIVICNSDRTPQTLVGVADTLTAPRTEQWARGGGGGEIIYGSHEGAGALAFTFNSPTRTFCSVVANGRQGTSGQDVYDHWFKDAPL